MRRLITLFDSRRLLGGTVILGCTQLLASIAGLVRDRALYSTFPQLGIPDTYFAAFRPSDFLFQACILSALGTVLVPVLAGHHAHGRDDDADRVLSATLHIGAMAFGVIALILALVLPLVAPFLVQFEGEQLALYVQFGRLALLSNFLFVFGTTFGQHLIAAQRYWAYGLTPVLYTCGTIAGTLLLTPLFGPLGPMLGTIAGAAVYALVRAIAVLRSGAQIRLGVFWHPDVRRMGVLMLPRMLSLGAVQLQLLAFDFFASGLGHGAISINVAARNFQSVVVGAVGIALAQAVYSPLSKAAARGEWTRYHWYLRKAVLTLLALSIPGAIALVVVAPFAAALVSLTAVLPVFALVLAVYATSIPLESLNHVLLRAHYALRETLRPALAVVGNGVTAVAVAMLFVPRFGIVALAAGFAAGHLVQAALLSVFLRGRSTTTEQTPAFPR